jgi:RimJ/RimL family protein N-acetyltransferase
MISFEDKIGDMKNLYFRKLKEEDYEEVVSMFFDFYAEDKSRVAVTAQNMKRTIRHWNDFPNAGCIYTFHLDNCVVGYANFIFYWSNEYGGEIVNLDELFIKKEYRGKGIALRFLADLDKLFGELVAGYELEVHPTNKGVIKLYEKAGFSINENCFMLKLKTY